MASVDSVTMSVDDSVEIVESYIKSCKSFWRTELEIPASQNFKEHEGPIYGVPTTAFKRPSEIAAGDNYPKMNLSKKFDLMTDDGTPRLSGGGGTSFLNDSIFKTPKAEVTREGDSILEQLEDVDLPILKKAKAYYKFPEGSYKEKLIMVGITESLLFPALSLSISLSLSKFFTISFTFFSLSFSLSVMFFSFISLISKNKKQRKLRVREK